MKVYIAAKTNQKEEVRRIYKLLEKSGHEITADWTVHKSIKPFDKNPEKAKDYSVEDINAVRDCDVFIMLTSSEIGSGSSSELGAAIMSQLYIGKPVIYVVGPHFGNNFCYFHPAVIRRNTIDEVMKEIEDLEIILEEQTSTGCACGGNCGCN